jgi:large subunit ribosomal protein L10
MENPRPEKVAVVEEVRGRLAAARASVVTEYRGLTVAQMAELRRNLAAMGDFKVYKNTLVRLAIAGSDYEGLTDLLSGPTAIAFVTGEISAAAKTLRDFARTYPALVVKGGLVDGSPLDNQDFVRLADLPSREVLLARIAGGIAAPIQQLASLIQALPRNLAYGLSALLDQRRAAEGGGDTAAPSTDGPPVEVAEASPAEGTPAQAVPVSADATEDAVSSEAIGDAAPAEASTEDTAPVEATQDTAPVEATEDAAPVEATEDAAPVEATEDTAPAEASTEDGASAETTEADDAAPIEATEDAAPAEASTEDGASAETTEAEPTEG